MKKYYLVTNINYFVDPHGSPDTGGESKSLAHTDQWDNLKEGLAYTTTYNYENGKERETFILVNDANWRGSEDGYNSEESGFRFKEITEEQYVEYGKIINAYNNLP